MASRIRFSVTDSFTPEMDELRQTFTSNPWPDGTSIDPFDNCSFHILAFVENQLAGMVRLSAHPISPLASWVLKPDSLRSGIRIVEATRAVVSPEFRGNGIYKALMANAVIWAFQHNICGLSVPSSCLSRCFRFFASWDVATSSNKRGFLTLPMAKPFVK